ncbi:hypothetical protein FA95DRAFT_1537423 [Auriscalpium vulgare]|uniref:Uncharacterized protein n=1 Tax=Auriscalpium vulgare TaxID=40419 RepID=A0ACB8S250_9AGAM|nr:hypothetical protein FA95DRAFT_1537423 [Auriscalpium vulgare]
MFLRPKLLRRSLPPLYVTKHTRRWAHSRGAILDELGRRGFISQMTRPEMLDAHLCGAQQTVYSGIDPTASSLHVGHILPMMCLVHFQLHGHKVIPLIGGATARIGDPSGRSTERPLMERTRVDYNIAQLTPRVRNFFSRAGEYAKARLGTHSIAFEANVRNNLEWFEGLGMLEFLRVAGTTARVNSMLARESVSSRMESQQGISFAEFSYQLLQAYDFLALNQSTGCTIQIGGSDQWGNIVAGIELLNRAHGASDAHRDKGFGITTPLLTTATGEKFGKSAGNAVWLDEEKTSVYEFYQFFLRTTDEDVGKHLKIFTLLSLEEIDQVLAEHNSQPERRIAQKYLADEVTELVHTAQGLRRAHATTQVLFSTDISHSNVDDILAGLAGDPLLHTVSQDVLLTPITKLAVEHGLVSSNGAARKLVKMKGLYLNGKPVAADDQRLTAEDVIGGRLVVLRVGKANHVVLAVEKL